MPEPVVVLTVGHSIRPLDEFLRLLVAHEVTMVADVRTVPRSRRNPQFNREPLPAGLGKIGYVHMPGLGGLRHPKADSPNTAWKNDSFRGFADHMQTEEFEKSLEELVRLAGKERVVVMCAESLPWRCHRSLIADALSARGLTVEHIFSPTERKPHRLTPWACVDGTHVTYPSAE